MTVRTIKSKQGVFVHLTLDPSDDEWRGTLGTDARVTMRPSGAMHCECVIEHKGRTLSARDITPEGAFSRALSLRAGGDPREGPTAEEARREYGAERTVTIQLRVTETERAAWDTAAAREGMTRSAWLRRAAQGAQAPGRARR